MPGFTRKPSLKWHTDVPGTRWFRADLHVHTLDDHPNPSFKWPDGLSGPVTDPEAQRKYARALLKEAILNGIEVLGVTPHAVRAGDTDESCAAWRVVETWNDEADDDGIPFRDKVYAVFPGFEPNLVDGSDGLHLLFLFDPEIGREKYLNAFAEVMGAVAPYKDEALQISTKSADDAFRGLYALHDRMTQSRGAHPRAWWNWLCIAPHAFSEHGLFKLRSQVLQNFPHKYVAALQLKPDWLPQDAFADKPWLRDALRNHRQCLIHASDALAVNDIGGRSTLLKLGSPRIESLRQAFLASDSRVRIPYNRGSAGSLSPLPDLPEAYPTKRPWLASVVVQGGTSFFGGTDPQTGQPAERTFRFSPDLTCIIGSRMSGKSTLLDGLRIFLGFPPPSADNKLAEDVRDRAQKRFLSGNAQVTPSIRGSLNPAARHREQWPALFYAQRELQKVAEDQNVTRDVLYHLVPAETDHLLARDARLQELDAELQQLLKEATNARERLDVALGCVERAEAAVQEMNLFREAGIQFLLAAQQDKGQVGNLLRAVSSLKAKSVTRDDFDVGIRGIQFRDPAVRSLVLGDASQRGFTAMAQECRAALVTHLDLLGEMEAHLTRAEQFAEGKVTDSRHQVQHSLVRAGRSAEDLNQFAALSQAAGESRRAQAEKQEAERSYRSLLRTFAKAHRERHKLIDAQRGAMRRVVAAVDAMFQGKLRVTTVVGGVVAALDEWVGGLRERGVTRWWNTVKLKGLHPDELRRAIRNARRGALHRLEMSEPVQTSFLPLMTGMRRMELASLRSEDRYVVELRVDDATSKYRDLPELSGGAKISVLLSLILETGVNTPLVIDQPEDETDKEFLRTVLLPALRRLKGHRQIIFATHDANIVVNGDADHVIVLKADADHGWVEAQGTIDDARVKAAIVTTLDGGEEAFALRKVKYGF